MRVTAEKQRRLAEIGAEARLREIDQEREELLSMFPSLRNIRSRRDETQSRRKRGPMSPAARKRLGQAMRKAWARRKAKQKTA